MALSAILSLILGISLLFLGRRLFWLFVGVAGFIAGLTIAPQIISSQSELVILLIAIIFGIIGAFLAVFLEGLAILIAGFLAGGYLMTTLIPSFGTSLSADPYVTYIIGGIIGLLLVAIFFGWAIIILSALMGAQIIMPVLHINESLHWGVLIALVVFGIVVQASVWHRRYPVKHTWGRRPWY